MGIFTFRKNIYALFLFINLIAGFTESFAQCPTVVDPTQSFCDVESPVVASLVATNNGGGVVWYDTATSTTPLPPTLGLDDGGDYYADSSAGCGSRQLVTVTVYSEPTGPSFQGVCVSVASDATFLHPLITVVGNNIRWYATSSSTVVLPMSTVITDNTIYYASQTNPDTGCETSRLPVFFNVGVVPTPTGSALQQFCNTPGNGPTVASLVASGANNWYLTSSSPVVLELSTPLVDGQTYFATTVDPPCESINRLAVVVDLVAPNNAGTNGTRQICQNQVATTPPFNLFGLLGGTPDNTGVWTGPLPTSNGFQGTVNVSSLTLAGSPYVFTYTVSNGLCAPSSATVTLTVLPLPVVSISASATTICSGGSTTVTFTGTPNATVTYTVNNGPNQTIVLNGSGIATITSALTGTRTYTLVGVASSGSPSCSQAFTNFITITVLPLPTVTLSTDVTVCFGGNATVTFTGTPNATVTYTVNNGPAQTIVLNGAGVATLAGVYTATTVYNLIGVASSGSVSCSQPQTDSLTVTVIQLPVAALSDNVTICPGGQTTVTFTGTPNATVTYTVNNGPNQTITLNGAGTATITSTYTASATYTIVSVATAGSTSCSQPQADTMTVNVLPLPTVQITQNTTICSGGSATVTFTGTPNATVTYTVNNGPNQTIVLNGAGTASISGTYTTTTVFTLVSVASSGTPSCSRPLTNFITITVLPLPMATITQNESVCPGSQATVTFTGTPNATVTYTVNNGPNQTLVLNAGGTASFTQTYNTTTVYHLIGVATQGPNSCNRPLDQTITITVLPLPTVTISSGTNICSGQSATVTFTGTPNATVTYTVNNGPNQTIVLNASGIATITATYTATTVFTVVSVASAGNPGCSQPQPVSMTITVLPLPIASLSENTIICSGQSATVIFTGTPNATVTYTVNNGPNQTIVLNGSGTASITSTYTATTVFTLVSAATTGTPGCSQPQTDTMTITVSPLPTVAITSNATICSGQNATVTFTGTPNATVTYTINNGPNQTIVLNGSGTASISGTYTQTTVFQLVSIASAGVSGCTAIVTGLVTITVIQLPTATIAQSTNVCPNGQATVTFTGTPNATITYTVNDGPNQTIVLNASGTATITANYTVTTHYELVSAILAGSPACSQPLVGEITITVLPLPVVAISSDATICSGGSATVTFTGTPNATVTYMVNNGPNQTIVLNGSGTATLTGTYTATTIYALVSVATEQTPSCVQPQTASITITVLPLPTVTISGNTNVCPNGQATVTFTGTANALVTYTVNNGPTQTITLNGSGTATLTSNYTVTTTYTLISVTMPGIQNCIQPLNTSITITVLPLPTVVISVTSNTICAGTNALVTFTGTPNATVTYNINNGPNQAIGLNEFGVATISPVLNTTTVYTLVAVSSATTPTCTVLLTDSVTVTTVAAPNAGSDVANAQVCANATSVDLFGLLGAGAQPGGTWSPALASGTGVFNPAVDPAGTYIYTLAGTPPCLPDTASVTVSIIPPPNAGNDATTVICSNADVQNLFTSLGANAQAGGTWSPALASGTGVFNPAVDPAGNYTYTITGTVPCGSDAAVVTVQIVPGPDAGQDGVLTVCINSNPQNLFQSLNGTPQVGGTWSPALASGTGVFNPAVDAAGVYTYTFFGNQPCDNDTATVTVTVNPIPDAGENGEAFFCSNYPASDLFASLGGTPQSGGTWSPAMASGMGVFNPLVDAPGVYTYTVGGDLCSTDMATVTVTVVQSPDAGGPGTTLNACVTATSVDLFTGLDGTQGAGTWNDDNASGALSGNIFNPSQAGFGTYNFTYTVGGGVSPCLFDTATVTVVVDPQPNAGISTAIQSVCISLGTFDLFTLLDGTQQAGGDWTDADNATVTNPLDISAFTAGTYSFTYTITNACGTDSEIVQLTVLPLPTLTIPNITLMTPICLGQNANIMLNGVVDGVYDIVYNLSGANTVPDQTIAVTVTGGIASFAIPAGYLQNTGITTITFVSIANTATGCESQLVNVLVNVVINPIPVLSPIDAAAAVGDLCLGSDVTILFGSGATPILLQDGNYQFNLSIPNGTPNTSTTGLVTIVDGEGQFTIPGSTFPGEGFYFVSITGIINLSTGCVNLSPTAGVPLVFYVAPDVTGANVAIGTTCLNTDNQVFITNANNVDNEDYTIQYTLSGANTGSLSALVAFTDGSASFTIPAANLVNGGSTTITITQMAAGETPCGNNGVGFNPVTFEVTQLGTPVLVPEGDEFCADDNPTIQDLSANITGTETVVWYDAPTGGTAYDNADLLQNGVTYYAAYVAASGCESAIRLPVTVDLTACDNDIIIPDGFSPNGDNINDEFVIVNLPEMYPKFKLEIYNRYGNILYKGNINTPNWNGAASEGGIKIGNEVVPVGVYFFILEFNDGARKPMQGRVYLSR